MKLVVFTCTTLRKCLKAEEPEKEIDQRKCDLIPNEEEICVGSNFVEWDE